MNSPLVVNLSNITSIAIIPLSINVIFGIPIATLGLILNTTLLYIITKSKKLHTPVYILVWNLSLTNNFLSCIYPIGLIGLPLLQSNNLASYYFGSWMCKISYYISDVFTCVSNLTLAIISRERYDVIISSTWSNNRSQFVNIRFVAIMITLIWLVSLLVCIPNIIFTDSYVTDPVFCEIYQPNSGVQYYLTFFVFIVIILPCLLMAYNYTKIGLHIVRRVRPGSLSSQSQRLDIRQKRNLLQVLIITTSTFFLFHLPHIIKILALSHANISLRQLERDDIVLYFICTTTSGVAQLLIFINPIIFLTYDRNIKGQLKIRLKWYENYCTRRRK